MTTKLLTFFVMSNTLELVQVLFSSSGIKTGPI